MEARPHRCSCPALDAAEQRVQQHQRQIDSLQKSLESLTREVIESTRRMDEAERRADHDSLTGLANRHRFPATLQRTLEEARSQNRTMALLFIDLDGFKNVNDQLGHPFGDEVLKITAAEILKCIRENDIAFRYGGDEFLVILPNLIDPAAARAVAQDIGRRIGDRCQRDVERCAIRASIGVALYPRDGISWEALLRSADAAMYEEKLEPSRNRFAAA